MYIGIGMHMYIGIVFYALSSRPAPSQDRAEVARVSGGDGSGGGHLDLEMSHMRVSVLGRFVVAAGVVVRSASRGCHGLAPCALAVERVVLGLGDGRRRRRGRGGGRPPPARRRPPPARAARYLRAARAATGTAAGSSRCRASRASARGAARRRRWPRPRPGRTRRQRTAACRRGRARSAARRAPTRRGRRRSRGRRSST